MVRNIVRTLFYLYLTLLLYLLFFSSYRSSIQGVVDYNLIPFKSISRDLHNSSELTVQMITNNLIGNVLAFLPFGFFLPFITRKVNTYLRIIIFSASFSFFIECTQFTFRLGAFDVDDIILNSLGALVGFWLGKTEKRFLSE